MAKHATTTALVPLGGGPAAWASRINAHLGAAVDAIVATGRELVAAKAALAHGDWERMFVDHPKAIANPVRFSARTAERLMAIAQHPILSKATHVSLLPPAWGTLYALARLPPPVLERALAAGRVRPDLERAAVRALADEDDASGGRARSERPQDLNDALARLTRTLQDIIDAWRWPPEALISTFEAAVRRARKHFNRKDG